MSAAQEFRRVLLHVDMDSFYASCELTLKPELGSEPYVVGADPKNGKGRGVVLACNYPARKFGLHSGMPISTAWRLCPQAHYDQPHFDLYEKISSRVMKLLSAFADKLEQVSIDEAYLDASERVSAVLSDVSNTSESKVIEDLCHSIMRNVSAEEKITCSIGAAESKLVAKIASDVKKPNGLTIVKPAEVLAFLGPLEVSKIPGVGTVTQRLLFEKFSVKTISQLREVPVENLKEKFGRNAVWLSNASRGIDESQVIEGWEPLSISGETTFLEDEGDYHKIRRKMLEVARDVHDRAASEGHFYKSVGIKIRFSGFETHTRSRSLPFYSNSLEMIEKETEKLLIEFEGSGKKVRLIGVKVSNLLMKDTYQRTLSEWELWTGKGLS